MKLYHCSRIHHKVGDIIEPRAYGEKYIWVTLSKTPHYTLYQFGERSIGKQKYHLYQIRPLNPKTKIVKGMWDDLMVKGAVEVIAAFGEAAKNRNGSMVVKTKKNSKLVSVIRKPIIKKKTDWEVGDKLYKYEYTKN